MALENGGLPSMGTTAMSPKWIPFIEERGQPFEAPDKVTAESVAETLYGDKFVRVQSEVSLRISDEDRASVAHQRRLRSEAF